MRIRRSLVLLVAMCLAAAALVTMAPPSGADHGGPFHDGDTALMYANIMTGDGAAGSHLDGWLNEHNSDTGFTQIGGFLLYHRPFDCPFGETDCLITHIGYCTEADADAVPFHYNPYYEISIDPRLSYLTWKYGFDFYLDNYQNGDAIIPMAATQALVWAWFSDPETGSTVFSDVAGGFDDPFNWDGLSPSAHTDTSPRVGFHSNEPSPHQWTGTDQELLDGATQAVYDLAVEATEKAGPWTLGQGVGATGVVLTGANGPIEGEIVTFDDGSDDEINFVTDANGFAAWPAGATLATAEGPAGTYETPGDTSDGEEGQNIIITIGEDLVVSINDPAPTTTTTTTTTTSTTTTTVVPTTTTTTVPPVVEPPESESPPTTTAPGVTTTTAAPTTTTLVVEAPEQTTTTTVVAAPAPDVAPQANPQIAAPSFTG